MHGTDIETNISKPVGSEAGPAPRVHGGNIAAAARRYGLEGRPIIDFSSNVNASGPSRAAVRAAKRALAQIDRYPDSQSQELRRAIARYHGIKPEHILCGNGSNGLIHLIPRVLRPANALIPVPSFVEYAAAVEDAGGTVTPFALGERDGFRLDPVDMSFALAGKDLTVFANPNNPTGRIVSKADVLEILRYAAREGATVVVDEAFMDYDETESVVKEAVQAPNLIVLRAFTKFFGMPGLRIGYAVMNDGLADRIGKSLEPWTVNIPAQAAAVAALQDWSHIERTRKVTARERERLAAELRLLPGIEPFPASANFIFIKLNGIDGPSLTDKLGLRGILVRDCSSFPGLDARFLRVAVRTARENRKLIKALRAILLP